MKNNYFSFLVFICLWSVGVIAQNNSNAKKYITQLNFDKETTLIENKVPLFSNIQSQDNFIELNQKGINNQIDLKMSINDAQIISQNGKDNYFQYLNYYNKSASTFNILQQGKANSIHIYGENSLVKKLSIVQKTNHKTLIIRNF